MRRSARRGERRRVELPSRSQGAGSTSLRCGWDTMEVGGFGKGEDMEPTSKLAPRRAAT